jgi:hypothetical protein
MSACPRRFAAAPRSFASLGPVAFVVFVALPALFASEREAAAFCGFYVGGADAQLYNNATQVVLMREGTRTVLSMQNNYQGPPDAFAMVVPVPVVLQKENVKTLSRDIFTKVDKLAAPRLVEYWEQDPCNTTRYVGGPMGATGAGRKLPVARAAGKADDLGVTVEAEFTVGEYDIVILSAKDSTGLDTWLKREKYSIPQGAEPYLKPYVAQGSKFFVAKVDPAKVTFKDGMATLSPLRVHYDSDGFSLPVRLGLINSNGTQDLIVHILAKGQRYEVANYPNVTIPTNFDVGENARASFGTFYAALFDRTLEKNAKAVVTEYAWDAGTCDPCPGPALSPADFLTLGADALPSTPPAQAIPGGPGPGGPGGPGVSGGGARMGRRGWFPSGYVVTRLHARYAKDALGEDLVFRAAPPITGGREVRIKENELEHGALPGSVNNFQGRYAIRHPWTGPITCAEPKRGVWGGPPYYVTQTETGPRAATDTAFAPRKDVQLASYVRGEISELGVTGSAAAPSPVPLAPDAGVAAAASASASAAPSASATPAKPAKGTGCGACALGGSGGAAQAGLGALLFAAAALLRRRDR